MYDVLIIGCGVVGAAAAYEFSKYNIKVGILEAENDVGTGTSRANSAIIHAGYDPMPGTLMAKLNVRGNAMYDELCNELSVPFKRVGSLVLAFDDKDLEHIQSLFERGKANCVPELHLLSAADVHSMEPNLSEKVRGALYAPTAGIIEPMLLTLALSETAVLNGADLHLNSRVSKIQKKDDFFQVFDTCGKLYQSKYVINAAGLHSDEVHNFLQFPDFVITPCKGQYYLLDKSQGNTVKTVVFQCPTAAGKGVLVSPTIHGNLIVGPDSEVVSSKDMTNTTAAALNYVASAAKKSVPNLAFRDNIRNFAGLRALSDHSDFIIEESKIKGFFDLAGIKSPGLSCAPAIAEYVVKLLENSGLKLEKKADFKRRTPIPRFKNLSPEEKSQLIAKDPRFGRVICRCETVTEGEIVMALHSPIPPCSISGVKRRTGAGMGRCQGGFCSPRVCEIISRELNISQLEVLEDLEGSKILVSRTKNEVAE